MRVKYLPVAEGRSMNIGQFPNFSRSGSVKKMKKQFYGKDALLVRCGSYIYHVGNMSNMHGCVMPLGETIYFFKAH